MEELPSILKGIDPLVILGIEVQENADWVVTKSHLRRLFLRGAKKSHPDKQAVGSSADTNVEFARLKAAYDYLQAGDNFETCYVRAQNLLKVQRARQERLGGIAAKQATYLDALLQREKQVEQKKKEAKEESSAYYEYYSETFQPQDQGKSLGVLIVAAKTLELAHSSHLNLLLLGNHFPRLFEGYGILQVDPLETIHEHQVTNIPVARIYFESQQHAIKALLYYRSTRQKFRCDLYALALGSQEHRDESQQKREANTSLEQLEQRVFAKIRSRSKTCV